MLKLLETRIIRILTIQPINQFINLLNNINWRQIRTKTRRFALVQIKHINNISQNTRHMHRIMNNRHNIAIMNIIQKHIPKLYQIRKIFHHNIFPISLLHIIIRVLRHIGKTRLHLFADIMMTKDTILHHRLKRVLHNTKRNFLQSTSIHSIITILKLDDIFRRIPYSAIITHYKILH